MTKTCVGSGAGEGSGAALGDGAVRMAGDDAGEVRTAAGFWAQAASTVSAMRLSAAQWAMEIRPERGGRITSLRLDGEELLDQGIGVDQPTAEGFVEGGAFGWDEMVPNLEPTDTLPDHGEAWRLPWEVLGDGLMRCRGRLVPWELERRITLGDEVEVSYAYRNVGREAHAAYWCAHPLFKYAPVMDMSVEDGASTKVFLPRGSVDRMRIGRVEMSWDARVTPDVAIWLCNGDLGGYRQVAVEPATASPLLEPGATLRWWLRITAL